MCEEFCPERYERAAAKYRPEKTRVLFVAEAPPSSLDRYFYFEDVGRQDSLWVELMKEIFGADWRGTKDERKNKREWLLKFQKEGFQLIDALREPVDSKSRVKGKIRARCSELVSEIRGIGPTCIVLIKPTVYDALFDQLAAAGLPVVKRRLPFPGSGHQREFHQNFPREVLNGPV